jgi:hypothetical protein
MRRDARTHNPVWPGSAETYNVTGTHVVGIEQHLLLGPATEHRVAGVPRILEDCAYRAALPTVG